MRIPRYLVRKRFFEIQGPCSLEDLQKDFERGALQLEDELCGHTKRWVIISQRDLLKKLYPECATIFFPVVESGEFTPTQTETKRIPAPVEKSVKTIETPRKFPLVFSIAIVIMALGFFIAFLSR